jgi:hypothetical protein
MWLRVAKLSGSLPNDSSDSVFKTASVIFSGYFYQIMKVNTYTVKHTFMTHFIGVLLLQIYLLEYPSEYIKDNLPNYLGFIIIITLLIAFFFISY